MSKDTSSWVSYISTNFLFSTCKNQHDNYLSCIKYLDDPKLDRNTILRNCNELKEKYIQCFREISQKHIR